MTTLIAILIVLAGLVIVSFLWRWASRLKSLPCPTILAWFLESPIAQRLNGTAITLERLGLRPGQNVLEFGPGPGRLLIPAARRVLPGGKVCGIELQPGMIERLRRNAERQGTTNLAVIRGDATLPLMEEGAVDMVLLSCVLGEIPDRQAVLQQAFRALRPGGTLSVSEMFGDPHYQSRSTVNRLAHQAGFELDAIHGRWYLFTANFRKPDHPTSVP
jgi:ubiquinone/menaquinone biosynthesis C-methylase UbiE